MAIVAGGVPPAAAETRREPATRQEHEKRVNHPGWDDCGEARARRQVSERIVKKGVFAGQGGRGSREAAKSAKDELENPRAMVEAK